MKLRASAPGKLLLLGEYAVLEGAPALVMAVDRRAVAELTASNDGYSVFAPEVHPEPVAFTLTDDGTPQWCDAVGRDAAVESRFALVAQVMRALTARGLMSTAPFHLRLDSAAFFERATGADGAAPTKLGAKLGPKLGLGSSAAMTTALASVLAAYAGQAAQLDDRSAWLSTLLRIHREFQGGRGSGADVAAAVFGGVICYRLLNDSPRVTTLNWPTQLHRLWVWSGQSASTSRFLSTLESWRARQPDAYAHHMAELTSIAEAGARAAAGGNAIELRRELVAAGCALQHFGEASKIPIFSGPHRCIAGVVEAAGGGYKPCGAGGGDLGLAVAGDAATADSVRAALSAAGHAVLALDVDDAGLVLEQEG